MLKTLRITFLWIFTFLISSAYSQGNTKTVWTEAVGSIFDVYSVRCTYDSFPVINHGKEYYEILSSSFESGNNWQPTGTLFRYEDQKMWTANNTEEFAVFDFTLNVGDEFHPPFGGIHTVIAVDTFVLENGESRRRLLLNCEEWGDAPIYWIDGIGSTAGILNWHTACNFDISAAVLCYWENDILLYDNPDYSSCWLTIISTEELSQANIKYYPNPAADQLIVEDPYQHVINIKIFDVKGQLIYRGKDMVIETSLYTPGLYTVQFTLKDGRSLSEKIIKQ